MTQDNHTYIAIDLKSFYASVECVERGLDSMTTNLVVADLSRTENLSGCVSFTESLRNIGQSQTVRSNTTSEGSECQETESCAEPAV